ncbi:MULTISPECIES: hypothetical protein [unclassified Phaeobacter]|uniref:hypothetical protein n=1 Tax=unclassified Phaeobacter TaxID=2621772 RepID=UPI003A8771AE
MADVKPRTDVARVAYEMALMIWQAEHGEYERPKFDAAPQFIRLVAECTRALSHDTGSLNPEKVLVSK